MWVPSVCFTLQEPCEQSSSSLRWVWEKHRVSKSAEEAFQGRGSLCVSSFSYTQVIPWHSSVRFSPLPSTAPPHSVLSTWAFFLKAKRYFVLYSPLRAPLTSSRAVFYSPHNSTPWFIHPLFWKWTPYLEKLSGPQNLTPSSPYLDLFCVWLKGVTWDLPLWLGFKCRVTEN